MFDQRVALEGIKRDLCVRTANQLTCHAPQRRLPFRKRQFACPYSASIWLPLVVLDARDRTNLSSHVARGTNLPFGKRSRDIVCRRSLIAGNARKKAASSRRRSCSHRASWRSVVAIYGLCEHTKPVPLAPQRPETTSMTSPIALRQTSLHRTAIALTWNSATNPSNEAG
jgi:hypothetical protein